MSTRFETSPLTDSFGVIVQGINLSEISEEKDFPVLRALFEEH